MNPLFHPQCPGSVPTDWRYVQTIQNSELANYNTAGPNGLSKFLNCPSAWELLLDDFSSEKRIMEYQSLYAVLNKNGKPQNRIAMLWKWGKKPSQFVPGGSPGEVVYAALWYGRQFHYVRNQGPTTNPGLLFGEYRWFLQIAIPGETIEFTGPSALNYFYTLDRDLTLHGEEYFGDYYDVGKQHHATFNPLGENAFTPYVSVIVTYGETGAVELQNGDPGVFELDPFDIQKVVTIRPVY